MIVATTGDEIAGDVIAAILFATLYLAPVIVAAARRSRNLMAIALVDVLLGWTFFGWIAAWVMIFVGNRTQPVMHYHYGATPYAYGPSPYGYAPPTLGYHPGSGMSPDGLYWWDGTTWRDTRTSAPPYAQRSSDGRFWWDGVRWRQVPAPPPPVQ